jgi:hypothetical protein
MKERKKETRVERASTQYPWVACRRPSAQISLFKNVEAGKVLDIPVQESNLDHFYHIQSYANIQGNCQRIFNEHGGTVKAARFTTVRRTGFLHLVHS